MKRKRRSRRKRELVRAVADPTAVARLRSAAWKETEKEGGDRVSVSKKRRETEIGSKGKRRDKGGRDVGRKRGGRRRKAKEDCVKYKVREANRSERDERETIEAGSGIDDERSDKEDEVEESWHGRVCNRRFLSDLSCQVCRCSRASFAALLTGFLFL